MSINDIASIPYNERNYFGYCNKVATHRQTIVYYGDEVYKRHPIYTNLIVGNYGTVINELNFGYKIIPFIGDDGHAYIQFLHITNDGKRVSKTMMVCTAVLMAHNYKENPKSWKIIHLNGNKMQNVYCPGSRFHNIEWATMAQYNNHKKFLADPSSCNSLYSAINSMDPTCIETICRMMQDGYNNEQILSEIGFEPNQENRDILYKVRNGYYRTDVSSKYNLNSRSLTILTEAQADKLCSFIKDGFNSESVAYAMETMGVSISVDYINQIKMGKIAKYAPYLKKYGLL